MRYTFAGEVYMAFVFSISIFASMPVLFSHSFVFLHFLAVHTYFCTNVGALGRQRAIDESCMDFFVAARYLTMTAQGFW